MDVAFDGAQDNLADWFGPGCDQVRPQYFQPVMHGLGCQQHLGYEHFFLLKSSADFVHSKKKAVVEDLYGC